MKAVGIPLFPERNFEYSISLEGQSYVLRFSFVERTGLYNMSILTFQRTPLLTNVALVPTYPIMRDYDIPGLTGYFVFVVKSLENKETYKEHPESLSQYYDMLYLYED